MRKVLIPVVSFAVLFGTAAIPWNAVSQEAIPAATANSTLSIPACAFQEARNTYEFNVGNGLSVSSGNGGFYAPVYLPNGARIRKIKLICIDEGGFDVTMGLYRAALGSSAAGSMAASYSTGSDANVRTFPTAAVSNRIVNTLKYVYYVSVNLPGTQTSYELLQVQIRYDAPGTF